MGLLGNIFSGTKKKESQADQVVLWGNLANFPIIGSIQYLHFSKSTGIFSVRSQAEGQADFWFQEGHIIRAKGPRMPDIGSVLRRQGHIDDRVLDRALRIQKSSEGKKPLGTVLIKLGVITQQMVRDVLVRQIEYVIGTALSWKNGTFQFSKQDHTSPDGILVEPSEIIRPGEVNIEHLLLEAVRKYDESRRKKD